MFEGDALEGDEGDEGLPQGDEEARARLQQLDDSSSDGSAATAPGDAATGDTATEETFLTQNKRVLERTEEKGRERSEEERLASEDFLRVMNNQSPACDMRLLGRCLVADAADADSSSLGPSYRQAVELSDKRVREEADVSPAATARIMTPLQWEDGKAGRPGRGPGA